MAVGPGFADIRQKDRTSVVLSVGVHVLFALGLVALAGEAAKRYEEVEMELSRTRRAEEPPPPPPEPSREVKAGGAPRARRTRRHVTKSAPIPLVDPGAPVEGASDNAMPAFVEVGGDPEASGTGVLRGTGTAEPAPAPPPRRVYDMGDLDSLPQLAGACTAEYPAFARQTRQSGFVMLQFTLDEQGRVHEPRVRASRPPGVFDQSALEGIRRCRYTVPTVGGRPVRVTFRHRMTFRLQ